MCSTAYHHTITTTDTERSEEAKVGRSEPNTGMWSRHNIEWTPRDEGLVVDDKAEMQIRHKQIESFSN